MQCRVRSNRSAISRCVYLACSPFPCGEYKNETEKKTEGNVEDFEQGGKEKRNEAGGKKIKSRDFEKKKKGTRVYSNGFPRDFPRSPVPICPVPWQEETPFELLDSRIQSVASNQSEEKFLGQVGHSVEDNEMSATCPPARRTSPPFRATEPDGIDRLVERVIHCIVSFHPNAVAQGERLIADIRIISLRYEGFLKSLFVSRVHSIRHSCLLIPSTYNDHHFFCSR